MDLTCQVKYCYIFQDSILIYCDTKYHDIQFWNFTDRPEPGEHRCRLALY